MPECAARAVGAVPRAVASAVAVLPPAGRSSVPTGAAADRTVARWTAAVNRELGGAGRQGFLGAGRNEAAKSGGGCPPGWP